jgi:arsenate reductase (glutaredoxin)
MPLILYGIPNCGTVKKARAWLAEAGIEHDFHDYKKRGIDAGTLNAWAAEVGWEALLNRSGTTFRGLPEAQKAGLDEARAIALMQAQPAMIRRPALVGAGPLQLGFKPDRYQALFGRPS